MPATSLNERVDRPLLDITSTEASQDGLAVELDEAAGVATESGGLTGDLTLEGPPKPVLPKSASLEAPPATVAMVPRESAERRRLQAPATPTLGSGVGWSSVAQHEPAASLPAPMAADKPTNQPGEALATVAISEPAHARIPTTVQTIAPTTAPPATTAPVSSSTDTTSTLASPAPAATRRPEPTATMRSAPAATKSAPTVVPGPAVPMQGKGSGSGGGSQPGKDNSGQGNQQLGGTNNSGGEKAKAGNGVTAGGGSAQPSGVLRRPGEVLPTEALSRPRQAGRSMEPELLATRRDKPASPRTRAPGTAIRAAMGKPPRTAPAEPRQHRASLTYRFD
jgi:hypothetical protein